MLSQERSGKRITMRTRIRRSTPTCHEQEAVDENSRSSSRTSISTIPTTTTLDPPCGGGGGGRGSNADRIKVVVASRNDITKMTEKVVQDALDTRCEQLTSDFARQIHSLSEEMDALKSDRDDVSRENRQLRNRLDEALVFYSDGEAMMRRHHVDDSPSRIQGHHNTSPSPVRPRRKKCKSRAARSAERDGRYNLHRDLSPLTAPEPRIKMRTWRPKQPTDTEGRRQVPSSSDSKDYSSGAPAEGRLTRRKREKKYVDDNKWPAESPVAGVYDVTNSSAKMVIYNNRKGSGNSRLRGYTNQTASPENPERHLPRVAKKGPDRHLKCNPSKSTHEPKLPGAWLNSAVVKEKEKEKERDTPVPHESNTRQLNHHANKELLQYLQLQGPVRAKQVLARGVPEDMSAGEYRFLHHPELTGAEKKYLMSVASVYNVSQLKQNKQNQYRSLLKKQLRLGFASASEYEKYIRYLETPRNVQSGPRTDSPDTHSKGKNKSDALLSRRRAAQDTNRLSHDGATSATDEEYLDLKDRRLKSAPPSVGRIKKWEERKEGGKAKFVEVSDKDPFPKKKSRKAPREVWDPESPDGKVNSEFNLLKAISDEADRAEEQQRTPRRHSRRDKNMRVESISPTSGSGNELSPYPPYTPREGTTRPRSRLGRTKPKSDPEEYDDISDLIQEDRDTNAENSLLVVMEKDESFEEEVKEVEQEVLEAKKCETGIQAQILDICKDVSTSVTDMTAYLASQPKPETVETGTSTDLPDLPDERTLRRERRRKRREERDRQAEELRQLNISLASLKSEMERNNRPNERDDTVSMISRDTIATDSVSVNIPEVDEEHTGEQPQQVESGVADDKAPPATEPKVQSTAPEPAETEEIIEQDKKPSNEVKTTVIEELMDKVTDEVPTQQEKQEGIMDTKESRTEEVAQTKAPEIKDQNIDNVDKAQEQDKSPSVQSSVTDMQETTISIRGNLTIPVPLEAKLQPPEVPEEEEKVKIEKPDSLEMLPTASLVSLKSEVEKADSVTDDDDEGDNISMMMRMEENPLDPIGTVDGLAGLLSPPPPSSPEPRMSVNSSALSLNEVGYAEQMASNDNKPSSPKPSLAQEALPEEPIEIAQKSQTDDALVVERTKTTENPEPSTDEMPVKADLPTSDQPEANETTVMELGQDVQSEETQKMELGAEEKNLKDSYIDLETSRLCNNALHEATMELSQEENNADNTLNSTVELRSSANNNNANQSINDSFVKTTDEKLVEIAEIEFSNEMVVEEKKPLDDTEIREGHGNENNTNTEMDVPEHPLNGADNNKDLKTDELPNEEMTLISVTDQIIQEPIGQEEEKTNVAETTSETPDSQVVVNNVVTEKDNEINADMEPKTPEDQLNENDNAALEDDQKANVESDRPLVPKDDETAEVSESKNDTEASMLANESDAANSKEIVVNFMENKNDSNDTPTNTSEDLINDNGNVDPNSDQLPNEESVLPAPCDEEANKETKYQPEIEPKMAQTKEGEINSEERDTNTVDEEVNKIEMSNNAEDQVNIDNAVLNSDQQSNDKSIEKPKEINREALPNIELEPIIVEANSGAHESKENAEPSSEPSDSTLEKVEEQNEAPQNAILSQSDESPSQQPPTQEEVTDSQTPGQEINQEMESIAQNVNKEHQDPNTVGNSTDQNVQLEQQQDGQTHENEVQGKEVPEEEEAKQSGDKTVDQTKTDMTAVETSSTQPPNPDEVAVNQDVRQETDVKDENGEKAEAEKDATKTQESPIEKDHPKEEITSNNEVLPEEPPKQENDLITPQGEQKGAEEVQDNANPQDQTSKQIENLDTKENGVVVEEIPHVKAEEETPESEQKKEDTIQDVAAAVEQEPDSRTAELSRDTAKEEEIVVALQDGDDIPKSSMEGTETTENTINTEGIQLDTVVDDNQRNDDQKDEPPKVNSDFVNEDAIKDIQNNESNMAPKNKDGDNNQEAVVPNTTPLPNGLELIGNLVNSAKNEAQDSTDIPANVGNGEIHVPVIKQTPVVDNGRKGGDLREKMKGKLSMDTIGLRTGPSGGNMMKQSTSMNGNALINGERDH